MIGLVNTKSDFLKKSFGQSLNELIKLYPESAQGQVSSWETLLKGLFFDESFNSLPNESVVGIEYLLPIEGMGIDLFISGKKSNGQKVMYIIESKEWNDFYVNGLKFSNSRSDGDILHPQLQVYRHYLAVKNYLSLGQELDEIIPILYLGGCTQKGVETIKKQCSDSNAAKVPIFTDLSSILGLINQNITSGGLNPSDFLDAFYSPSRGIIDAMKSLITHEPPFILTPNQEKVVQQIKEAIRSGKKIIRVVGAGGSGKTAIMLNMFVSFLANQTSYKAYFSPGAQNFKLYRFLYESVQNVFSSTYGLRNLAMRHQLNDKCILFIDEAQHNEAGLLKMFVDAGCTIVTCYDDQQVINLTNSAIAELKQFEGRSDFVGIELTESVRFNGSLKFEPNIHRFLNGETNFEKDDKFDFRIFKSLDDIVNETIELIKKEPNSTVALAGLLSNDADEIIKKSNGKLKIDWSQPVQGIPAETRWIPYVNNKKYLENMPLWVGTWWAPGLDFDYVVVIVGGDAKMTPNGLVPVPEQAKHFKMLSSVGANLGLPIRGFTAKQQCDSLMAYVNQPGHEKDKAAVMEGFAKLLSDNYYIMLTRGRKGCFVYFADNENDY